jgi:hypothetical protein
MINNPQGINTFKMSVYPNPTTANINLKINTYSQEQVQLKIINTKGQVVLKKEFLLTHGFNQVSCATNNLPSGVYSILILSSQENYRSKFVKK